MTTLAKPYSNLQSNQTATSGGAYERFIKKMEFSHFAFVAMSILVASCLGGITTMQIFEHDAPFWQFILSAGITMANLVGCLGQAPTKWVVNLFGASIIVNLILLLINVL